MSKSVISLLLGAFGTLLRLCREDVLMFHTVINLCVNTNLSSPLLLERVTQLHHGNHDRGAGRPLNQRAVWTKGDYMFWIPKKVFFTVLQAKHSYGQRMSKRIVQWNQSRAVYTCKIKEFCKQKIKNGARNEMNTCKLQKNHKAKIIFSEIKINFASKNWELQRENYILRNKNKQRANKYKIWNILYIYLTGGRVKRMQ